MPAAPQLRAVRFRKRLTVLAAGSLLILLTSAVRAAEAEITALGWLSIVPPILAILLALTTRDVVISLFTAVFAGALFGNGWNPFVAFARTIDSYIVPAIVDQDHASILVFSALLGAMVGLISKSGGAIGIVERLKPYATSRRRGQLATWTMGLLVFFDDYANTLLVGPTMRPITDRLKISREKLAYIVDSTAAPVASLIPISTWIGFEIGLVGDAFSAIGSSRDAFTTIVASIPYRFYQWLALVMGFTIAYLGRDFGAMWKAERRAVERGEVFAPGETPLADFGDGALEPPDGKPRRARNAVAPIAAVAAMTLIGLWITGSADLTRSDQSPLEWTRLVLSSADSYKALLWASLTGVMIAMALSIGQRILSIREATAAAVDGVKATLTAFVVLILAWSLGAVCEDLGTAEFLVQQISDSLAPQFLPSISFVLAAAVAFATGTSWGTMSILTPLVIPISHSLSLAAGHPAESGAYSAVLLATVASVLAGSVWGDHCSPISDTTILSSMASGSDHLAHVRTQLPYAVTVGLIAVLLGYLPSAFGLPPGIGLLLGAIVLVGVVRLRGRSAEVRV